MLVIAATALLLGGALLAAGRNSGAVGLAAGALIAEADAWLLGRSLSRFEKHRNLINARALTMMMFARFLTVAAMVGVVITARGLDPIGVIAGFLLFPVSITLVGVVTLRQERAAEGRLGGAAR
jgi:hypothetical protein